MTDAAQLEVVRVLPSGPLSGRLDAPSSKSVTNRLLVVASLAEGTSRLSGLLESDDTDAMTEALGALGVGLARQPADTLEVSGRDGVLRAPDGPVSARLSGTTLRFLLGVSLLVRGRVVLDGDPPLRRRPLAPLLAALEALGARVESDGGYPPVTVESDGHPGGEVVVDATASSQFVTALLLAAPYAARDTHLTAEHLSAAGFVDLTLDTMRRWGAEVERVGEGGFVVGAGRTYRAGEVRAEYDASGAAHLFALAAATGGEVTVSNAVATVQPDAGVVEVMAAMGARVTSGPDGVTVTGGDLVGVDVDLSAMPDQVPTIAVLGALASGTTRLRNIGVARGHETDRLAAVATELGRLGARVEEAEDSLVVRGAGAGRLHGGTVETYDDHRMAMAFAALAAVVPGVVIRRPGCVAKTYPGFWSACARLGLGVEAG